MREIAAIFDVDRTLIAIPTERLFFVYLLWRRVLSPGRALHFLTELARNHRERHRNKSYLRGLPAAQVESLARDCYHRLIQPRISPTGRARLQEHQRQGHQIVLLTGSLECLMTPLQRHLQADWLIASRLQISGTRYTGSLNGPHPRGDNKLHLLRALAPATGFKLSRSYAYADDFSDLPLLQQVGQPVAVNPSRRLRAYARQHSWRICRF